MFSRLFFFLTFAVALLNSHLPGHGATAPKSTPAALARPAIAAVRGKVVTVRVPEGFGEVTLRQRTGLKKVPWRVLAKRNTDPAGEVVRFVLRNAVAPRALQVEGRRVMPAATNTGAGIRLFGGDPRTPAAVSLQTGALTGSSSSSSMMSALSTDAKSTRTVTESDIWKISGDRLYFFNQLRGLQVFDISNPDDPALLGQLREPGRGDQMYALGASHLALLTRPSWFFSLRSDFISLNGHSTDGDGTLLIADISTDQPREVTRVPYDGYVVESRLVGDVLYVVSHEGLSGLLISSFDLSDPTAPRLAAKLSIGSYGGVVSATDRYLFVVRYDGDWNRSRVEIIDISDPRGSLVRRGSVQTAGRVEDKFRLHLDGDRLTTVSAVQLPWTSGNQDWRSRLRTAVENFDLTDPAAPVRQGGIEIGIGEWVRAARFTSDRLYVVTALAIDPLWVIDYHTPQPTLLGELKVPGFSTYIAPLGDRLVAVGRIDSQAAVSLYDVSDPTAPKSLTQLPLGENFSYSGAVWDEKVLGLFPEQKLIVIPYSGYDGATGWANRVQLIDLGRDALTPRGVLQHPFNAQRSTIVADRLMALDSSHLLTVDLTDRDKPTVTSDVEIAWRVDRVFLVGNHLIQLGGSTSWDSASAQTIGISPADAPESIVSEASLPAGTILGATLRDQRLYVLQQTPGYYFYPRVISTSESTTATPPKNPLVLSIYDVSQLPEVKLVGRSESEANANSTTLSATWPAPGTLVWVAPRRDWWWRRYPFFFGGPQILPAVIPPIGSLSTDSGRVASSGLIASSAALPYRFWQSTSELFIYDVSNGAAPKFIRTLDVRPSHSSDWSEPIAAGGKLYLSALHNEDTPEKGAVSRAQRHFLSVVDFADPANPVVTSDINLPGRLLALQGDLLLTLGCAFRSDGAGLAERAFHSSRLTSTSVTLVDQLQLPGWFVPFAVESGRLTLLNGDPVQLQSWSLNDEGKFTAGSKLATVSFSALFMREGLLIATGNGAPRLFDLSDPNVIRPLANLDTTDLIGGFEHAIGSATLGLWQPTGAYGVTYLPLPVTTPRR